MASWLSIILKLITHLYLNRLQKHGERVLKFKAARAYLKTLILTRQLTIAILALYIMLNAMLLGMVILLVAVLLTLPWPYETKLAVLAACGAILFLAPFSILVYALSEKTWVRLSGVQSILEKYAKESRKPPLSS